MVMDIFVSLLLLLLFCLFVRKDSPTAADGVLRYIFGNFLSPQKLPYHVPWCTTERNVFLCPVNHDDYIRINNIN